MPKPLTRQAARLFSPEGRTQALEEQGVPSLLAGIVNVLLPEPGTPPAAVRAMDPMAASLSAKALKYMPKLVRDYLVEHPWTAKVFTTSPRMIRSGMGEPGFGGYTLTGFTLDPRGVAHVWLRQPGDVQTTIHELGHVAQRFAGRYLDAFPGLQATPELVDLYAKVPYGADPELLANWLETWQQNLGGNRWVTVPDHKIFADALRQWFGDPLRSPVLQKVQPVANQVQDLSGIVTREFE